MLKATEKLDVPVAHSGVTLPIGVAIFRWTGPAMNFAVAIYVAHWFGIPLGPGQIAAGLAAGAITTMGAVGLPGTVSFVSSIAPIAIAMGVPIAAAGPARRGRDDPRHLPHARAMSRCRSRPRARSASDRATRTSPVSEADALLRE